MGKIKAILFDMDGVLIDAKEWHYEALNQSLGLFGYTITRSEHLSMYDGLSTRQKLEKLTIEKGLPKELHDFINEMKQKYTVRMIYENCRPRFNHEYALSKLKSEGYKIAVCSNSIRMTIKMMMEYARLDSYLDCIISKQDVKKPKPDPEVYLTAMRQLHLESEECLICEDNDNGIKAVLASHGHLMTIRTVDDVNYEALKERIARIEER